MAPNAKSRDSERKRARRQSGVRERTPEQGVAQSSHPLDVSVVEDASIIERLLDDTSRRLAETPPTPLRRELYLVVERYRRALREWATLPPTRLQRDILIDCVKALHQRVASRSWRKFPASGSKRE